MWSVVALVSQRSSSRGSMRATCSAVSLALLVACGPGAAPPIGDTVTGTVSGVVTSGSSEALSSTSTPTGGSTHIDPSDPNDGTADPSGTNAATSAPASDLGDSTECDPLLQDCPEGEKCTAWVKGDGQAWNANKCVKVMGDGAPGEPCTAPEGGTTGIDDCGFGAMCWDVGENDIGTCVAMCTGEPGDVKCPPAFSCAIADDGILFLCFPWCDPLGDDCTAGYACIPMDGTFGCFLNEAAQVNDICVSANACAQGLLCIESAMASAACDAQAPGCCQPYCELPNGLCPNPDQQCRPWYDPMGEVPPGYEDVGFCGV